jgi:hypothetical protein
MSPEHQDHLTAPRDALSRAREADERLRSALAEATVWLTLAMTDETGDDDRGTGDEGDPA